MQKFLEYVKQNRNKDKGGRRLEPYWKPVAALVQVAAVHLILNKMRLLIFRFT